MDKQVLSYYNQELAYIRKMGAEFADAHPKIAGRLRLDQTAVEDPHVSRLIESFAFLTARIRLTLDDSFPQLTEALLGLMHPAYQSPMPSLTVVKSSVLPKMAQYQRVPSGSEFIVNTEEHGVCRFRACDDLDVLPVKTEHIRFAPAPVIGPKLTSSIARGRNSRAVLKVTFSLLPGGKFEGLTLDRLRFFISAQPQVAYKLIDYFANRFIGGCVVTNDKQDTIAQFDNSAIHFPEFDLLKGGNLPVDHRKSQGQRAITDFFVFPEKHLFVDIQGLSDIWAESNEEVTFYLHFDDSHSELVQAIDANTLQLGCVPAINLFKQTTEAMPATDFQGERRLNASRRDEDFVDIHQLLSVQTYNASGQRMVIAPFYGSHRADPDDANIYWYLRRENSDRYNGYSSSGTDSYLSLVDQNFELTSSHDKWLVDATAICTNRDIPSRLPFGPGQPQMSFAEGGAGLRLKCMLAPTAYILPKLEKSSRWDLVARLRLQDLGGDDGLARFRSALEVLDIKGSRESRSVIDAISSVSVKTIQERVLIDGRNAMVIGSACYVTIDEKAFSGVSLFLFAKCVHRFLISLCAVNTFVKTSFIGQSNGQELYCLAPELGLTPLL